MNNANMPAMPITLEPGEVWSEEQDHAHGLTKREYFAAMAMQGLMANSDWKGVFEDTAWTSVAQADALLAELEKTK